jgi:ABC-type nitrate/sulfonate/bicarbonate transport system permease component
MINPSNARTGWSAAYVAALCLAWECTSFLSGSEQVPHLWTLIWQSFEALSFNRILASRRELVPGLWPHVWATFYHSLACVVVGTIAGLGITLLAYSSRFAATVLSSLLDALRSTPPLLFIPVAVVFFGVGEFSLYISGTLYAIASIAIYATAAKMAIEPALLDQAHLIHSSTSKLMKSVLLPYIFLKIGSGVRLTITATVGIMLVVEYFIGGYGLGRVLTLALYANNTELIFIAIFWAALVTYSLDCLHRLINRGVQLSIGG